MGVLAAGAGFITESDPLQQFSCQDLSRFPHLR